MGGENEAQSPALELRRAAGSDLTSLMEVRCVDSPREPETWSPKLSGLVTGWPRGSNMSTGQSDCGPHCGPALGSTYPSYAHYQSLATSFPFGEKAYREGTGQGPLIPPGPLQAQESPWERLVAAPGSPCCDSTQSMLGMRTSKFPTGLVGGRKGTDPIVHWAVHTPSGICLPGRSGAPAMTETLGSLGLLPQTKIPKRK